MNIILDAQNLRKSYGDLEVIRGISFYVERGSLFAFLGPNGAGKSTTISMLTTQIVPDSGSATIDGFPLGKEDQKIRAKLGIVFQESVLDTRLSASENAETRAGLYGMHSAQAKRAAAAAIAAVHAEEFAKRPYGKLSGGQRRKADIARALVHMPAILFLDEPTTGLDPAARNQVWDTVRTLQKERGITIFLTTHYMEEAAQADYTVVIKDGTILAKGTPAQLRENHTHDVLRLAAKDESVLEMHLRKDGISFASAGGQFEVAVPTTLDAIPLMNRYADLLESVEVVKGSMEQAFLNLIGKVDSDGRAHS